MKVEHLWMLAALVRLMALMVSMPWYNYFTTSKFDIYGEFHIICTGFVVLSLLTCYNILVDHAVLLC